MTPGQVKGWNLLAKWLPLPLRAVVIALVLTPAVRRFTDYELMVRFFGDRGIPAPEVTVALVGVVEVAAVVLLALGIVGRLIAVPLAADMVMAMAMTGITTDNAVVLLASLGIIVLGTGALSPWQPEGKLLGRYRWRVRAGQM